MIHLSDTVEEEIKRLCAQGDELAETENYDDALRLYWKAWEVLPEPRTEWEAATWILAAIGDANFFGGDFVASRDNLSRAMRCPGAIGNPFLHLRFGQCELELEIMDRAADNLARAYLLEGRRLFKNEDPKYLAFIKGKLDPPPGGWSEGW